MEYFDVVNENDKVISSASREECHKKGLLHRGVEIFVFKDNSLKELLIQKRGKRNEFTPGKLCGSAGGHLIKGDSYLKGAIRELKEELFANGLPKNIKLKKVGKFRINDYPNNHEIIVLFCMVYPGPFGWSRKEIAEEPNFVKLKDLIKDVKNNSEKYTECFKITLKKFIDSINSE